MLLKYFPLISNYEDLFSTYVANCVFNNFLCYTAIVLNIVAIHSIKKTSSLPQTLKTLLVSLALSDVGVGLFVQPFYTSLLVKWLQQSNPGCVTYCGDHCVVIECIFISVVGLARYSPLNSIQCWFCLSPSHSSGLQSHLCRFATPSEPNSSLARRSGDTGLPQRNGKFCERWKVYCLYILRICYVSDLLYAFLYFSSYLS